MADADQDEAKQNTEETPGVSSCDEDEKQIIDEDAEAAVKTFKDLVGFVSERDFKTF